MSKFNEQSHLCLYICVCVYVTDIAYWTRSLSARDRLQHLTSGHPHPNLAGDEVILDEQTRRLLDDSHLLIATQRLVLLDIIGQGPFIVSCKAITRIFFFGGGGVGVSPVTSFLFHPFFLLFQSINRSSFISGMTERRPEIHRSNTHSNSSGSSYVPNICLYKAFV